MQWEWDINRIIGTWDPSTRTDSWDHQSNVIQICLWILLALIDLMKHVGIAGRNISISYSGVSFHINLYNLILSTLHIIENPFLF